MNVKSRTKQQLSFYLRSEGHKKREKFETLMHTPHQEPFGEMVLYKQESPEKRKQALDSIKSYPFKRKQNSLSITYSTSTLPYFTSYLLYFCLNQAKTRRMFFSILFYLFFSLSFLGEYYDVFVLFSNNTTRRSKEFGSDPN